MAWFSILLRLLFLVLFCNQIFSFPTYNKKIKGTKQFVEKEGILKRHVRQVLSDPRAKWPNAIVPYQILENVFSERMERLIKEGMEEFHKHTCIRFVPHKHEDGFIVIAKGRTCETFMSRFGRQHLLLLNEKTCDKKGIILHELMHILGFVHEQMRPDRDKYVIIRENNIIPGNQGNFKKLSPLKVETPFNYSYDTIMHYPENMYSKDKRRLQTIEVLKPGVKLPNPYEITSLPATDIERVNAYYDCPKNRNNGHTTYERMRKT